MMGKGHAISGFAVWLGGCATAQLVGHTPDVATVVLGAGVCAGWALAPDLDHPKSTVARSLGPVTGLIAMGFGVFGARVHAHTKTRADRADLDGHRTVSHTAVWAFLSGFAVVMLQRWLGPWAAAVLVFMATQLGLVAGLPRRRQWIRIRTGFRTVRRLKIHVPTAVALAFAAAAYRMNPDQGWWLGVAVATGSLVHCLGDCLTDSACPLLWPIPIGPIGQERRWYPIGPPSAMRFSAGGLVERLVVQPLLVVEACTAALIIAWPSVAPVLSEFVQSWKSN